MSRPPKKPKQIEIKKVGDLDLFSGINSLLTGKELKFTPRSKGIVQLELSPNPVIFIEAPKYMDGPQLHYPQFEVVRDFFELLCPDCNDIERIRVKRDVPRSDQILFEYGKCPKCGMLKTDNHTRFKRYNELVGVVGMRGGKSVLVAAMSGAIIHQLLCVDNLQEKLGLVRSQEIDGAFVAASSEQASETIYSLFRGFYDNSPWFQHYRNALRDYEISGIDPNIRRGDLYSETDRTIHFKEKYIRIKSLASNSGSLAGKTRIFAVIDELARMDAGESKRSATEVYRVLKRSLITISSAVARLRKQGMHDIPDATMFSISSPMFEDDKIMSLLKQSDKNEKMFAFHRSTWEFNEEITKEDLAEEYETDPIGAERDYGANPPGGENPLVQNTNVIEACLDKNRKSNIIVSEEFFSQNIRQYTFNYIKPRLDNLKYKNLGQYVIHCDPGLKMDSFSVTIGHMEEDIVIIDGVIECRPIKKNNRQGLPPREVYFPAMTDLILQITRKLSVKYISYDRWNSIDQIHRLREAHMLAVQKDIDRNAYVKFLNSMVANKIRFPDREDEMSDPSIVRGLPCSKALWELKRLSDDGVRVDHPPGGSSDVIQGYVGVHRLLVHPEDVIDVNKMRSDNRKKVFTSRGKGLGKVVRFPPKGMPL